MNSLTNKAFKPKNLQQYNYADYMLWWLQQELIACKEKIKIHSYRQFFIKWMMGAVKKFKFHLHALC